MIESYCMWGPCEAERMLGQPFCRRHYDAGCQLLIWESRNRQRWTPPSLLAEEREQGWRGATIDSFILDDATWTFSPPMQAAIQNAEDWGRVAGQLSYSFSTEPIELTFALPASPTPRSPLPVPAEVTEHGATPDVHAAAMAHALLAAGTPAVQEQRLASNVLSECQLVGCHTLRGAGVKYCDGHLPRYHRSRTNVCSLLDCFHLALRNPQGLCVRHINEFSYTFGTGKSFSDWVQERLSGSWTVRAEIASVMQSIGRDLEQLNIQEQASRLASAAALLDEHVTFAIALPAGAQPQDSRCDNERCNRPALGAFQYCSEDCGSIDLGCHPEHLDRCLVVGCAFVPTGHWLCAHCLTVDHLLRDLSVFRQVKGSGRCIAGGCRSWRRSSSSPFCVSHAPH